MTKQTSKSPFKWHYLIIATIMLGILASFFVVGASADEISTTANYDDGLYTLVYSSDYSYSSNWTVSLSSQDVYIIHNPSYSGDNNIRIKPIAIYYTTTDGLYFRYSSYDAETDSCVIKSSYWQPSYALYGYFTQSLLDSLHYSYLLHNEQYEYPSLDGKSYSVRDITNECFVNNNDRVDININYSVYSSLNNTYYGSFNWLVFNANTGILEFHNTLDGHAMYFNSNDDIYITIDDTSNFNDFRDLPLFSYYFLPYTPTETPIAFPFTSIADFVTNFISTIIEGLGSLEFYPGVSLLTLLYCFVGVLLVRYLLKLIAGG